MFWLNWGASLDELLALDEIDGVGVEDELSLLDPFEVVESFGEDLDFVRLYVPFLEVEKLPQLRRNICQLIIAEVQLS